MMKCLSLKAGLSWLIAIVLISTLLVNIVIEAVHAGPRVRVEAESNLRLTREMVIMTIASLQDRDDPLPTLRRLYQSLGALRHVDIRVLAVDEAVIEKPQSRTREDVPVWFVSLIGVPSRTTLIPVRLNGKDYGRIAIISNPLDELAEVWSAIEWLAAISLAISLLILAVVLVLVRFSLAPFDSLRKGLAELEAGKAGVEIPIQGASEFRSISRALNSLALTLDRVKKENRTLLSRLIEVQEDERREIARDLHDEAGPALFSIRASAVALFDAVAESPPNPALAQRLSYTIEKTSEALQILFRDLLRRLRPNGLAELGLNEAMNRLVEVWREKYPEVGLNLNMPHDFSSVDEYMATVAYRIVQEALTNIFRHASAQCATIDVAFDDARLRGDEEEESRPVLKIEIEDNGVGLPQKMKHGLGLVGMRERVDAVGGKITIENHPQGGTRILALLPLVDDEA